jgi:hypothetical protein
MNWFKKVGVGSVLALVGVAALVGGIVSLALHDSGPTTPAGRPSASRADRDGPPGPPGFGMRHFRRPSAKQVLARRKQFHAALAKELGVSTEKVDQAFRTLLEKRLDQAVSSHRLTRKQADRMLKCYDTATCKPPFRHRMRFRGGPPPPGAPPMGGPGELGPPM